ncbi:focadhesin [Rhinatrema bivittatum]|uniref:focadhesin n=1 Tax=Rhinatrema bivittatum TaxID=194408 RepID=UPI00112DDB0A|nr:focadhesin [Rhinatrema bivittatum]
MTEELGKRFEFPNSLIQSQAVNHLIATVLKENVSSEKICQSSKQTPALNVLWEKCCSDHVVVRAACCEALVALVAQDHADFNYVLNGILNLTPSARNIQGLVKGIGKLLEMQVLQTEKYGAGMSSCLYAVRNPPHPFITVLENRSDCWPVILQQLSVFLHHCPEWAQSSSICMVAPFLRYLYCEPAQLRQHAELRISLLKVFLRSNSPKDSETPCVLEQCILRLFCGLTPHLQLNDLMQVTEVAMFLEELSAALQRYPTFWNTELCQLSLQLLCVSEVSLRVAGDCSTLIRVIERNASLLKEDFPSDQVLIGAAVLLLQTPASQQKPILTLAQKILSCSEVQQIPVMAPILVMPLLQILSSTSAGCTSQEDAGTSRQQLAVTLLEMVQKERKMGKRDLSSWKLVFPITSWYSSLYTTWRISAAVKEDNSAAHDWLSSIKSLLPVTTEVPVHVSLLVAYLLVQAEGEILRDVLSVIAQVAKTDSSQVPNLVPVLMFKLGQPLEPVLYRDILYTLPTLGTHKVCVAQILRAIQILGSTPKLRAITLRLMTSLWEKQDRVYPELQKFMQVSDMPSQLVGKEIMWEKTIAKAASIRDICRQRPYQHGADMLAAISQILNECSKPDQATPAALVLQGLHALCQAEVVDIRSTWNALSPKLSCDTRPLILKTLHELFALVPSLKVKTEEYEKFKANVVSFLWNHTQSKDQQVATTAYKSLCKFDSEEHTILHLPEKARPEVPPPEEADIEEEEREVDLSVPGSSYVKLMLLTAPAVLPAFREFEASLVKQEMANMPRGVYHTALRGCSTRSDQGKTVAGVPNFMLKMYEKNKQPGLKPGLAAGMLLCYDLPIQMDRDGRPINRFLASRGRSYQQMLTALIHEVSIQPSDWHRSIVLPQSWLAFMNRTYHAVLQGRQAELEMQLKHGKEDPREVQYKKFTAWLWVRDMLTDVIKSASKDSPVVQGNSLLALTGLAVAVAKYESSLPSETEGAPEIEPDIFPTTSWLAMVLDTLLSIVDNHYRPKGRVFPWFQHKSYSGENTASAIARSCAATALSLLVPVFIISCKEMVEEVLSILTARLPGKQSADESQAVQIHMGLALGMFISRLCEEKVSDVSGQQLNLLLMKSLDALEDCCFDTSLEYNTGCILGVGMVLSFMSHSGQTESRVHVSATLRKLCKYLEESMDQTRTFQEVLSYCVACVGASAFGAGIIDAEEAEEIMCQLRTLTEHNQQTPGLALSLGNIVHGLSISGHGKAEDLNNRLLPAWIKILLTEGCPTMQRLAAVNGLIALVGSEGDLIQLKSETVQSSQFQSKLNEVIRTVTQIVSLSGVIGLQTNAAWLLGHLHLASLSSNQSRASVPPDFGYLTEKSLIRAAVDFIIDAGKKGPESVSPHLVQASLEPIAVNGNSYQYPPVNWSSILSPLMRLKFGEEVQQLCIELAVTQAQSSQNAAVFLGMWIAPPLVYNLSMRTRKHLFTSLPLWMKHVSEDKLQTFTEVLMVQQFEAKDRVKNQELCLSIFEGLNQGLKLPSPPQYCWSALCKTTEKIYELLPNEIQTFEVELYINIAKCLSEMADTEIDRICHVSKDNIEKATFLRVYLVSQGRVPLLCLNDVIRVAAACSQKGTVVWMMMQAFYQARLISHENTGVLKRMEWLLELMGHIRNVAYKSILVENVDLKKTVDFLLWIFAASVVTWADHAGPLLLGVRANWLPKQHEELPVAELFGRNGINVLSVQENRTALPSSLQLLLSKEPWKEQTQKFIDWLFNILESPDDTLSEISRDLLKATLLALRFRSEFKKKAVWAKAYGY